MWCWLATIVDGEVPTKRLNIYLTRLLKSSSIVRLLLGLNFAQLIQAICKTQISQLSKSAEVVEIQWDSPILPQHLKLNKPLLLHGHLNIMCVYMFSMWCFSPFPRLLLNCHRVTLLEVIVYQISVDICSMIQNYMNLAGNPISFTDNILFQLLAWTYVNSSNPDTMNV